MSFDPGCILLSLISPIITVKVLVPDIDGVPVSLITIGIKYSFCCSLLNDSNEETMAIPSPFAPSATKEKGGRYRATIQGANNRFPSPSNWTRFAHPHHSLLSLSTLKLARITSSALGSILKVNGGPLLFDRSSSSVAEISTTFFCWECSCNTGR